MANVCSNLMEIEGDPKIISQIENMYIENTHDEEKYLTELFPYIVYEANFVGSIASMSFESRWLPPIEDIEIFSKHFNLKVYLRYEEPGCGVFGEMWFENGDNIGEEEYEEEEWVKKFDPTYADLKESVDNMGYPNLLKHFAHDEDTYRDFPGVHLEKYLLSKIKAEDLPLLASRNWSNEHNREVWRERLTHDL